jgi:hypothetical protein
MLFIMGIKFGAFLCQAGPFKPLKLIGNSFLNCLAPAWIHFIIKQVLKAKVLKLLLNFI